MQSVALLLLITLLITGCGASLQAIQVSLPSKDGSGPDLDKLPMPTGIRFYGSKLYKLTTYVCVPPGATSGELCKWERKRVTTQELPDPYTLYEINYSGVLGKNSFKVMLNPNGTLQSVLLNESQATQETIQIIRTAVEAAEKK